MYSIFKTYSDLGMNELVDRNKENTHVIPS